MADFAALREKLVGLRMRVLAALAERSPEIIADTALVATLEGRG